MKKKKDEPAKMEETPGWPEEIDQILQRKKIQNKVLKELIEQLNKYPITGSKSIDTNENQNNQ